MKQDDYRTMMEQISLSEESRERIWKEINQKKKRPARLLRRPLLLAAVIVILAAMLVTVTAVSLRSSVFFPALGAGASRWEAQISEEAYLTIPMEHYSVEISNVLFTASSVNYVATIRPTEAANADIVPDFDLSLRYADGTLVEFASNTHISLLGEDDAIRYTCSHLLDVCVMDETLTLALSCHLYEKAEDMLMGGYEPGRLLASGSAEAAVQNVDREVRTLEGSGNLAQITLTPVSLLLFGETEGESIGLGASIESVVLEFEDGQRLVLVQDFELQPNCRGAIGNTEGDMASYFIGFEAMELTQVTAVCINGTPCYINIPIVKSRSLRLSRRLDQTL